MEFVRLIARTCAKFEKNRCLKVTGALLLGIFTMISFTGICPTKVQASQKTLSWDASTSPDVIGYKMYYGTASGNYSENIDVGNVTSYTVSSLIDGQTYYFAAKAYDSTGNESGYSNEVSMTTPTTSGTTTVTINTAAVSSGDLNGDGVVNVADALLALQIATGQIPVTSIDLARGDVAPLVNGKPLPDGKITIADALIILQKAVGSINW